MNSIIYNFFLTLFQFGIKITAIWKDKSRNWIKGRKDFPVFTDSNKKIWVHCASLGEFEQARLIIERLKKEYPEYPLILSFFSPSGYEIRKNYPLADQVIYLPMDGKKNADKLIDAINPALVVWVKYEYWYYYLKALKTRGIPTLLVSCIFRENQPFFKPYGRFWRNILTYFSAIFTQDQHSADLLASINITQHVMVNGDTRFDRVLDLTKQKTQFKDFDFLTQNQKVLVAGSTWAKDEELLATFQQHKPEYTLIVAPHEIDEAHLQEMLKRFNNAALFSNLQKNTVEHPEQISVWIVDQIGILSQLYHLASITYVGGGFNASGIHNILEAAVWGKPVFFGPNYIKFREANALLELGGCFSVSSYDKWETVLNAWKGDPHLEIKSEEIAAKYVKENGGATERIMDYIYKNRLLTKASN